MLALKKRFPMIVTLNGQEYTLRLMQASDRSAMLGMAQHLSVEDLSFMRRDITQPEMIDAWIDDIQRGKAVTLLIEENQNVIGYGTLYYNQFFWNRHLAEVRVLISSSYRNRGLGAKLTRELMQFARELRLDKVMAYMAVENKSAQMMLGDLGFKAEAILTDWVKTRDDYTHDLLIMSVSLAEMAG